VFTEEEIEEWGDNYELENLAKKYVNLVRERKGLKTEQKLVQNAEKQRTLTKMR